MAPIRSKLMELSYSDPKFQIRLTGYADTVIIDSGTQQTISAIRFGGYPEVVRALSDAIYGGASVELKQDDTTLYLDCRPKGYRRLLSHDGIYAVATLMANDDSQTEENTADDSDEGVPENPRKCYIFCPPGDRASLFAEVDRKTAAPLIPEFQDYVLDSLIVSGDLRQMKVLSFTERMEAWSLTLLPEDRNVTDILEQGLKDGNITIPGAVPDAADGFAEVSSVTSYLNTFGVMGDIICCLDESGSTEGEAAAWGKAVAMTLLEIAAESRRSFALIHFAGSSSCQVDIFRPGEYTLEDKLSAAETFLGGGTNFERPIREAIRLMESEGFEKADVVFITDGECELSDGCQQELQAAQAAYHFTVTGILLDEGQAAMDFSLKPFCQKIYRTSELTGDAVVQSMINLRA